MIPYRVETIKQDTSLRHLWRVESFLGMVSFYTRFIPEFSTRAVPLQRLKGKGVPF